MPDWEKYGALSEDQKTFTFNKNVEIITADIAKTLPDDVENLVGDGVKIIGKSAFDSFIFLKTATFQNATTIEDNAFDGCFLETATFEAVTTIGYRAFASCFKLKTATFEAATTIGEYAFYNCSSLEKAEFKVATTIGKSAFAGCEKLTTADFPNDVPIAEYIFKDCPILEERENEKKPKKEEERKNLEKYGTLSEDQKTFTFNEKVETITYDMVRNLPGNVKEFVGCGVKIIKSGVFADRTSLTTVKFPNAITIGENAFRNCSALEKAEFKAVTEIENWAFKDCYALTTVNFPSATTIGEEAFANCKKLTKVDFQKKVAIGKLAFSGCSALKTANIAGVTEIEDGAFQNCKKLEEVKFSVKGVYYAEDAFRSCPLAERMSEEFVEGLDEAEKKVRKASEIEKTKRKKRIHIFLNNKRVFESTFQKVGKYFVTDTASGKKSFSRQDLKNEIGQDVKKICPKWYDALESFLKDSSTVEKVKLSRSLGDDIADEKEKAAEIKKAKSLAILLISLHGLCDDQGTCYAGAAIDGLTQSGGFTSSLQSKVGVELYMRVAANILNTSGDIDKSTGKLKGNSMGKIKTIIDSSSVKLVSMPFDKLAAEAEKMANSDFSKDLQNMFDEK